MNQGTLSLILPAHNEEANLAAVVHECLGVLRYHFADFEIIIVDDGSSDDTPRIARGLAADYEPVVVLDHRRKRGYGAALISGFEAARGDYCMVMDADRQYSIGDVARLVPYVDQYDIVAGYRMNHRVSRYRTMIDGLFNTMIKLLFGLNTRDINCGFKLFRADLLRDLHLTSTDALIHAEIYAKATLIGASMVEVGVNHYPRIGRRNSVGSGRGLRALWKIVLLWWRVRGYTPPAGRTAHQKPRWRRKVVVGGALAAALGGVWTMVRRR